MAMNDLSIYESHGAEWWNPKSRTFRSLQAMTPFRIGILEEVVSGIRPESATWQDLRVLDLGCGGGLLSIPIASLGATVIGVDISKASLEAGEVECRRRQERGELSSPPTFIQADIRDVPLPDSSSDLVILADVVEHLDEYPKVLLEAARLVRSGGIVYVNTINRTWLSRVLALWLAENLGIVPKGTHDYHLFIRPKELVGAVNNSELELIRLQGESPRIIRSALTQRVQLKKSRSCAVTYSAFFKKKGEFLPPQKATELP